MKFAITGGVPAAEDESENKEGDLPGDRGFMAPPKTGVELTSEKLFRWSIFLFSMSGLEFFFSSSS